MRRIIAIIVYFLGSVLASASTDSMRYETMEFEGLIREVLASTEEFPSQDQSAELKILIERTFPRGEDAKVAFSRALAIRQKFPYCAFVAMEPSAGKWGLSIFRFVRRDDEVVAREDIWIYLNVADDKTESVTWTRGIDEY